MGRKTTSDRYASNESDLKSSSYQNVPTEVDTWPLPGASGNVPAPDVNMGIETPQTPETIPVSTGVPPTGGGAGTGRFTQSPSTNQGVPETEAVKPQTVEEFKAEQELLEKSKDMEQQGQIPHGIPEGAVAPGSELPGYGGDIGPIMGIAPPGDDTKGYAVTGPGTSTYKDPLGDPNVAFSDDAQSAYRVLQKDTDPDSKTFGQDIYKTVWQYKDTSQDFYKGYHDAPSSETFRFAYFAPQGDNKKVTYGDFTKAEATEMKAGGVKITPLESGNFLNRGEVLSLAKGEDYFSKVSGPNWDPFAPSGRNTPGVTFTKITDWDIHNQQKANVLEGFGITDKKEQKQFLNKKDEDFGIANNPYQSNIMNTAWVDGGGKVWDESSQGFVKTKDNKSDGKIGMVYIPLKGKYYPADSKIAKDYIKKGETFGMTSQGGPMYFGLTGTNTLTRQEQETNILETLALQRTEKEKNQTFKQINAFITGKGMGTGLGNTKGLTHTQAKDFWNKLATTKRGESFEIGGKTWSGGGFMGSNWEAEFKKQSAKYEKMFGNNKPNNAQSSDGNIYGL